jgi:thioredoxin reductase
LSQFLSPILNQRTDDYGGSFEKRISFPLEVYENVRRRLGKDLPICVKISTTDFVPGGLPVEEAIEFSRQLEGAGVDAIHASADGLMTVHHTITPIYFPQGCNVDLSAMIKKSVSIPVMTVSSINRLDLADDILASGRADMVCICRPLLADPYFPQKGKEGRVNDIRPCIRCTEGCFGPIVRNEPVTCTVNAELAVAYEQTLDPVARPKRVAVVGGGPAGLEAARVAAIKGHKVTLYEKRGLLGGNLIEDSMSEYKKERRQLITYFTTQLDNLGVAIKHEEATAKTIRESDFEAIIIATGANRAKPGLKGVPKAFVIDNVTMLFSGEMMQVMMRVAAVVSATDMMAMWEIMPQRGINVVYGTTVREISNGGVVTVDKEGKENVFPSDTVVVAPKFIPNDALVKTLATSGLEVYSAGDCVEPRRIYHAIHEGHAVARKL